MQQQSSKSSSIKLPNGQKDFGPFQIYVPTIIAIVGYVIMALIILLPFEYPVYDEKSDKTYVVKYNFGQRLLTLLLMTIPIILSVYTINCMMAGSCLVWSYVISIATIIWILMFAISAMIYTWSPKE